MKGKIIVTGAVGFIGRNVVAELNARGRDDLILVDQLGVDDKWRNLVGLRFEDLYSPKRFLEMIEAGEVETADAMIHLGACSATTETDADYLWENNFGYTKRLCEWSLACGARFVYASSAATYGDGSNGYQDNESELDTLCPLNMYGYSKHAFDLWAKRNGLFDRIVGLKYFNVFGPYEDHKGDMRSLVHKAYGQILDTGSIGLFKSDHSDYADGEQMRDFVYVCDAVDVTLYFLENRKGGGLFNCGTGKARTWVDLAKALFAAMERESNIRFIDLPEKLKGKYQYFTEADTHKLSSAGYEKAFTSLEDSVRDYVKTHLSR